MKAPRPEAMPLTHRLFGAIRKSDAEPIALIEARDEQEAAVRATYVLDRLGFGGWDEVEVVEVRTVSGAVLGVPTFLDAFFSAVPSAAKTH